jgi:hypothetical protein
MRSVALSSEQISRSCAWSSSSCGAAGVGAALASATNASDSDLNSALSSPGSG